MSIMLIGADLRVLRHLAAIGLRGPWIVTIAMMVLFAGALILLVGEVLDGQPALADALADEGSPGVLVAVAAMVLAVAPAICAVWSGRATSFALFTAPELELLLTAPISAARMLARQVVVQAVLWTVLCSVVVLPCFIYLVLRLELPSALIVLVPFVSLGLAAAVLGIRFLISVLFARFLQGRKMRQILRWGQGIVGVAIVAWLVHTYLQRDRGVEITAVQVAQFKMPWPFLPLAEWTVNLAGRPVASASWLAPISILALVVAVTLVASGFYRRAFELRETTSTAVAVSSRSWPETLAASMLRKTRLEAGRTKLALVLYAAIVVISVYKVMFMTVLPIAAPQLPVGWLQSMELLKNWFGICVPLG